jgi:hypothetical protein
MKRLTLLGCAALLMSWAALQLGVSQQPPQAKGKGGKGSFANAKAALAEPFKGVTTNGALESNLFPIHSTGVSTEPVRKAAEAFLAGLDAAQRKAATFPVDDQEWRWWINIHLAERQGVELKQLSEQQRDLAFGVLAAGLSAKGLKQSRDIMRLNYTIGEITQNYQDYGDLLYNLTFMGVPSATQPWGWQLEGHHLIINYFVLRDQVVMTPTFMGSEPIKAVSGKYAGTEILRSETEKGVAMMQSLTPAQLSKAVIATNKTGNNNLGEAYKDNLVLDYAGIPGSELTAAQRERLLGLIAEYVANMDDGHARVKMEEVRKHIGRTYFAWIGDTKPESVFYYRIHSPVILIEYDHQLPVALPSPRVPIREHVHTVVRTPNGNDYGKDLLRQHYAESHRAAAEE